MDPRPVAASLVLLVVTLALGACGGGGGSQPPDVNPSTPPPAQTDVPGPNSFLLFPNPQRLDDGKTLQTNTLAYAQAYYAAIDPLNAKDTFAKWKTANRIDQAGGTQATAVFGDFRDLGYGRRMTGRQNGDGTIAFYVENYLVAAGGSGYASTLNIDAAIVRDTRWLNNINAIEFSPGPGGTVKYAKFYSFDPVTGNRMLMQDIDGRGPKALPGLCISCHGGRADALESGGAFRLLATSAEESQRGDTRAHAHVFEVDALTFSTTSGYTRPEQEAALKALNRMVLCTYPLAGPAPPASSVNACRPTASPSEWQGAAADLLRDNYGGVELPNPAYKEAYVPNDWSGHKALYVDVVVPACRSCHIVRGTLADSGPEQPSDIDFTRFVAFDSFAEQIKAHVYDRGDMPLARIVFEKFWSSSMPEALATYLQATGKPFAVPARDASGRLLQPGRPIADPGPDRLVKQGATVLNAANSLFASTYQWRILSGAGATLTNASTATPTFTATANGTFVLDLVASQGGVASAPASLTINVESSALIKDPKLLRLADIRNVFAGATCNSCHVGTTTPTPFDTLDSAKLQSDVRSLINFTDIVSSPLLRKPSGHHHNGKQTPFPGFDAPRGSRPGDAGRENYDLFVGWIVNGAPR